MPKPPGPPPWVTPALIVPRTDPVERRNRGKSSMKTEVFADIPERYKEHLARMQADIDFARDESKAAQDRCATLEVLCRQVDHRAAGVDVRSLQTAAANHQAIVSSENLTAAALNRMRWTVRLLAVACVASCAIGLIATFVSVAAFARVQHEISVQQAAEP